MSLADKGDIRNITHRLQSVEVKIHALERNTKNNPGSAQRITQNNDQLSVTQRLQSVEMKIQRLDWK